MKLDPTFQVLYVSYEIRRYVSGHMKLDPTFQVI